MSARKTPTRKPRTETPIEAVYRAAFQSIVDARAAGMPVRSRKPRIAVGGESPGLCDCGAEHIGVWMLDRCLSCDRTAEQGHDQCASCRDLTPGQLAAQRRERGQREDVGICRRFKARVVAAYAEFQEPGKAVRS